MANPLDLRRLRHLHTVVDAGSFTRAAVRLGLSQPALSASIKSLESDLGVPLFTRHRSGARATLFAEMLVAHASNPDADGQAR